MIRLTVVLALLITAAPVAARPVNLRCTIKGEAAAIYGRLEVTIDVEALSVTIEAPEKMPGFRWGYRNGQVTPILVQGLPEMPIIQDQPATTPVMQFVQVTRDTVTMGWRTTEGELGQLSSFNRSALGSPAAPCVWHRAIEFDRS